MNTATPRIAAALARASRSAVARQSPSQLRPLGSRIQSIRTPTSTAQSRLFSVATARRDNSKNAPAPGTASPSSSKGSSKIYTFEEVRSLPLPTLPKPPPKLIPPRSAPTPKTPRPPLPSSLTSANPASSAPQAASPPPLTSPSPPAPTPSSCPPTSSKSALGLRSRQRGGGLCFIVKPG